ncbi:carbon starvation protein A [Fervidibacillus halotolerans]|uniref:Carbon starvation protein A n=1 Tax=Fervidibacillus halotolerans TaxID=2980027 RepID=A0A9E8RZC4_9BACI|nr:carbon starvation protein A [Fervidibacillus halotolerans]WAA13188.1 carbon starvation protein A [Fervidibacillus halotolerans]
MSAIIVALLGFFVFLLGYRYYSKFIAEKIYKLDPNYVTPAHQYNDGVDYVPTNKFVLWGHHFTSVAGAAPILGPAIALYWGWLPAFLWVILGTVFAAGVHDFGTLVLSVRHKGQSVGTIADRLIGRSGKLLFLFIILILVLMVNAVFAWVIANLFISYPSSVFPVLLQIPLAIAIGYMVYKRKTKMLVPSLIVLAIMYIAAIASAQFEFLQIDLVKYMGGEEGEGLFGLGVVSTAFFIWIIFLMVYSYIASILPVWKLLQPRDFINSHQLVVGLAILYLGLFFTNPELTAPIVNENPDRSWLPLLFITVACGAISGFHGLVSSGTSAKQLDKETDARFVGYFGAVGEGLLALVSILTVATFFSNTDAFFATYASYNDANAAGLNTFVEGASVLAGGLGIPSSIAITIVSIIVVSFAATTLDTSVRLMRYIISELGTEYKIPTLSKTHVATSIAVLSSAALVLLPEGPKGFGSGGYLIWPLFGTSNQLLAGISLMLISIWLKRLGRNYAFTLIPMIFLLFMTMYAMFQQVFFQWAAWGTNTNMLLFVLGAIIFAFALWIAITAFRMLTKKYGDPIDQNKAM